MIFLKTMVLFGINMGLALGISSGTFVNPIFVPGTIVSDLQRTCEQFVTRINVFDLTRESMKCTANYSETNESFCDNHETRARDCFKPVVDHFNKCIPDRLKGYPEALVDTVVSLMNLICTNTGGFLLEGLNNCLFPDSHRSTPREGCSYRDFDRNVRKIDRLESKLEVCQAASEIGSCWQDAVNQNCRSSKTKEFAKTFLDALLSTCRS